MPINQTHWYRLLLGSDALAEVLGSDKHQVWSNRGYYVTQSYESVKCCNYFIT